ncbi:MAG: di-trans,poly-cis-decaprenylcistransferase [Planctomycetia bacterium]|nr:di-trans,poly-cis-decaprenylcistransferase [Planctomycetia bacterium]
MATTPGTRTGVTAAAADPLPEGAPRHIAIIMDGNGRWAQCRGLPRIEGHRRGVASVRRITEHAARRGVEQLTLYCLSRENWRRPALETTFLMHLLEQYMVEERALLSRERIQVSMIGRRDGLPAATLAALDRTVASCAGNTGMRLCLAINYGGRDEIVDAARALAQAARDGTLDPADIDEEVFAGRLSTGGMPDPDLLIRTAGEQRVSNFLLWQISYAELWITDALWPDFDAGHLDAAIAAFAGRVRRFGGLAPS